MEGHGLTIGEAAKKLGVSARTVRRLIKSGKLKAELTDGVYGPEYRISGLPPEYQRSKPMDKNPVQTPDQFLTIIKELQEKNLALAAQLGAAAERIRGLESQVKLLTAPRKPWWQRLFRRQG